MTSVSMVRQWLYAFRGNTLLVNALYLMLSTFVVAISGFIFWVIVARTHDLATVGLATTLLSVSGLLSLLGLAGFDTVFVRFLPSSNRKQDCINSGFMVVTLVSGGLAVCVALLLPTVSSHLAVLRSFWPFVGFVFFTVITALNVLTNAVFLAHKRARDICGINLIFSTLKVILPLVIIRGGAVTIFVLIGISQLAGLLLSMYVIKAKLGHDFYPKIHRDVLQTSKKYSRSMYASSILNLLPPTLLPLIVVRQLGPENAAYYYMAFTIASVLYTISYASMQSAFAEGSHDEATLKVHVAKAAKLIGVLLAPAALFVFALSSFILNIFGDSYATKGSVLLRIFALSALPVAAYSALGAIFKVTQNLRGVVAMNTTYAIVILGLSYVFVPRFSVVAIGWAWMVGNLAAVGIGLVFLNERRYKLTRGDTHGKTTRTWR